LQCDFDSLDNIWIADGNNGLIKNSAIYTNEKFQPEGPLTNTSFKLSFVNNTLWVASGGFDDAYRNFFNAQGLSKLQNNSWNYVAYNYQENNENVVDVVEVVAHPSKPEKAYAASWLNGLLEIENENVINIYNNQNSILQAYSPRGENWTGIGGLAFDKQENLWLTNSFTSNFLAVLTNDGKLVSYDVSPVIGSESYASQIFVSSTGYKWCRLARVGTGILVFDDAGTIDDTSDDRMAKIPISSFVGSEIFSFAEDKDGVIWTGTDKGINVIYNTGSVFDDGASAQQIKVELDGYVQYLLETETVTAIAVDGGNRKWVGTINSGVYLLSADGTEQILHFTKENSPLLSNEIKSIVINKTTGEVFFGTNAGIISYRSDASESSNNMNNVYAFPNPVKPNFTGVVSIVGLAQETDVKITDAAGNIVVAIVSQGGTATWDLNNFQKQRVKSGVYMALCSNPDGSLKATTKIVVLN
jgi:ligand-binding sensor domain-containing protein